MGLRAPMRVRIKIVNTPPVEDLTPRQIVAELDKYIIGQNAAKKAIAVALRNRYRGNSCQKPRGRT